MRLHLVRYAVGAALLSLGGFCGCLAQKPAQSVPGKSQRPPATVASPLLVTVKTDKKTYRPTETIIATLKAVNRAKEEARLNFPSSQTYDFEIRQGKDGKGKRRWRWSQGRMFMMLIETKKVAPGAALEYVVKIAPADLKETPLTPGTYTLVGTLPIQGREPKPNATTTFTVK